jgi:hypothetical protein
MSATAAFLMSCGSPEFRFPDEWMTTPARVSEAVADTHISKWWSSGCPHQIHGGDVAVLVATKSGKVMGAFEVVGEPVEDRSHPHDPDKWPWTVTLRPLVLLDGTLAPLLRDFGLTAPHKYKRVTDPVASKLLAATARRHREQIVPGADLRVDRDRRGEVELVGP